MKNNYQILVLLLFVLGHCLLTSAQCYKGYQQLMNTEGTVQGDPNSVAKAKAKVYQPIDPNEIVGIDGYDAVGSTDTLRWVSATQTLAYTVYFENDPDLATATASKVTSTLLLHEKLN